MGNGSVGLNMGPLNPFRAMEEAKNILGTGSVDKAAGKLAGSDVQDVATGTAESAARKSQEQMTKMAELQMQMEMIKMMCDFFKQMAKAVGDAAAKAQ